MQEAEIIMRELNPYVDVPTWVKTLKSGDSFMVYFPRRQQVSYSKVVSNFIPVSTEMLAIITISYKFNNIETTEELLYDNYSTITESDNSWSAFQII